MACLLCLLLPLAAGAAPLPAGQGDTATRPRHLWPASAMAATDTSSTHRLYSSPSTAATESAVRALQENKWQAAMPELPSLLRFNLPHQVRLALITAPRFRADGLGFPMISVEFFSLKW